MRYGLDISPAGSWGHPGRIADLAALAEDHGWDGVFCEDYLQFPGDLPTYDVWLTLGLVAQATNGLTIGTMVTPIPYRHIETLAVQCLSVDQVSGGRLVLGVGSGDPQGDRLVPRQAGRRGDLLDAGLDRLRALWSRLPAGSVRGSGIPIWVGGALTLSAPRARALRWDGACLYRVPPPDWEDLTPDDVAGLRAEAGTRPYTIAVGGRERGEDLSDERRYVDRLADAGADWWHEYVPPRLPWEEAVRRVRAGPAGRG
jgi:alkanesulfonate monooxygenase SsuD/methylene tetrahydromethanopterin reductase-like flavin-dependent oxidoreductase (luciferase family)